MPSDHAKKRAAKKKEMAKGKRKGAKAAEEDPEIQVRARFTPCPLSSPVYLFFPEHYLLFTPRPSRIQSFRGK